MTSRQRFEAHVKSELGDIAVMDAGRYISPKIHNYWLTYQAAERDMLERCIKVLKDDAAQQRKEWKKHLASGIGGPATSYASFPLAYANKLKDLLND